MVVIWQAVLYTTVAVFGAISNGLVVAMWIVHPDFKKSRSSYFILNQSIIDALTSVFLGVSYQNIVNGYGFIPHTYQNNSILDRFLCKFWNTDQFIWALISCSTFNLVMLTAERYFKIVHPFRYAASYRKWKMAIALAFPWITGFTYQISFYYTSSDMKDGKCYTGTLASKTMKKIAGIVTFTFKFLLPIVIMAFCYIRILMTIRKGKKALKKYDDSSKPDGALSMDETEQNGSKEGVKNVAYVVEAPSEGISEGMSTSVVSLSMDAKDMKTNRRPKQQTLMGKKKVQMQTKLIKTLIFICLAFFFCWVWNQTAFFLANIGVIEFYDFAKSPFYVFSLIMAYLNCIINPFIYVLQFRKYMPIALPCCLK